MSLTLYSVFMAVFWSSILTLSFFFLRKRITFNKYFGIYNILILYLFSMCRMLLPLEFNFTSELHIEFVLNPVVSFLDTKIASMNERIITIGHILLFLWVLIAVILTARYAVIYYRYNRRLSSIKGSDSESCQKILYDVQQSCSRYIKVKVLVSPRISTPMGIGVFRKQILLPDKAYSDEQLYFILKHEYTHFLNHDTLLKWLTNLYCFLFWWNPTVYLLQKDLDRILEIKCDLTVTSRMNRVEKADYLNTILTAFRSDNIRAFPNSNVALLGKTSSCVEERFEAVLKSKFTAKNRHIFQIGFSVIVVAIFCFSYLFVVQSAFEAPIAEIETSDGAIMVEPEDITIRKNSDGTYAIVSQYGEQIINEENAQAIISQGGVLIDEESTQKKD